jgi:hypothetical protein
MADRSRVARWPIVRHARCIWMMLFQWETRVELLRRGLSLDEIDLIQSKNYERLLEIWYGRA